VFPSVLQLVRQVLCSLAANYFLNFGRCFQDIAEIKVEEPENPSGAGSIHTHGQELQGSEHSHTRQWQFARSVTVNRPVEDSALVPTDCQADRVASERLK